MLRMLRGVLLDAVAEVGGTAGLLELRAHLDQASTLAAPPLPSMPLHSPPCPSTPLYCPLPPSTALYIE